MIVWVHHSMNIYIERLRQISLQNKYLDWYCQIISKAITRASSKKNARQILGYCEKHHVLPRSYKDGGENDAMNIVYLTAREHILVHWLATKFSIDKHRLTMLRAYHCMCFKTNGGRNKRYPTKLQLDRARNCASVANKGQRGFRGPPSWSGCTTIEAFASVLDKLTNDNMSDPAISKLFGVSTTSIHNWKRKLSLSNRRAQLRDQDWLYDQYVVKRFSAQVIADIIGCSGSAVQLNLKKFGIPIRTRQ
jgi:hypothetical protein